MQSCIIIAPTALIPAANAFASAAGLPGDQFTVDYDDTHQLCHFRPPEAFLEALEGPIPAWAQVIDTDGDTGSADPAKVCVFLSAAQDGWVHRATVDGWPRIA